MTRRFDQWLCRLVDRHYKVFSSIVLVFVGVALANIISAHFHWFEWGILRAVGVLSGYYNGNTLQPLEAGLALALMLVIIFAPMMCCLGITRQADGYDAGHDRWRVIAAAILWATLALALVLGLADVTGAWYSVAYYPDNTPPMFINFTGLGPPRFWPIGVAWVVCFGLLLSVPALRRTNTPYLLIIGMACLMLVLFYATRQLQDWLFWSWRAPIPWHKLQYSGMLPAFLLVCLALLSVWACLLIELRRGTIDISRPGVCGICGYDLRGNPEGPCPECGTGPTKAKQIQSTYLTRGGKSGKLSDPFHMEVDLCKTQDAFLPLTPRLT